MSLCHCKTCRPITMTDMRMVLCALCGNKRCPHATNHVYACTGSNEVGQVGSSWEHVAPVGIPAFTNPFLVTEAEELNYMAPLEVLHGTVMGGDPPVPAQKRILDLPYADRFARVVQVWRQQRQIEALEAAADQPPRDPGAYDIRSTLRTITLLCEPDGEPVDGYRFRQLILKARAFLAESA